MWPDMTPNALVGLLAEPERLRVFAALVLGSRTPSELAAATSLAQRAVGRALQRLETGGLVSCDQSGCTVDVAVFKQVARDSAEQALPEDHGYADEHIESTVRTFVRSGRLLRLPAQQSRRRVVLRHIVQVLQPGIRYAEKEIDVVLRAHCDGGEVDHVALRRYLVVEGLLARDHGEYWRSDG